MKYKEWIKKNTILKAYSIISFTDFLMFKEKKKSLYVDGEWYICSYGKKREDD